MRCIKDGCVIFDAAVLRELQHLCMHAPWEVDETGRTFEQLSPEQVRYHLLRSLESPPEEVEEGRRMLHELAQAVGVTPARLGWALERRDGPPRRTWKLAVGQRSTQKLRWLLMREGGFISIGRNELGDLSAIPATTEGKAALRNQLLFLHEGNAAKATREANQFYAFVREMAPGDRVVAVEGSRSVGIGVITGEYSYVNDRSLAHRRTVDWLSFEEVPITIPKPRESLQEISHHDGLLLAIEAALLRARLLPIPPSTPERIVPPSIPQLSGLLREIEGALRRKGQIILVGPPGTGKTYWAERTALELASRSWFGTSYERLADEARRQLTELGAGGLGAVEHCCFHPSFGYEDFVEGLRPQVYQGHLVFERRDGLFKRLCRRALLNPGRDFFLVIDELNRADVPRVLGDLLTVIEAERRGHPVTLPLSGERLAVPPNVLVLATMNSADRSTSPLDAALRRRFAVIELHPDSTPLQGARAGRVDLGRFLDALNARIVQQNPRTGFDARVGQAFLLREGRPLGDLESLSRALQQDILPTLTEHFLGDLGAIGALLGTAFVDRNQGKIDERIFAPGNEAALESALLETFPEASAER
ncbi:MAG: AAA family ATPase [Myxococcales bacterium]|nr:AAA family ATPase [Myxococcales bacterium]